MKVPNIKIVSGNPFEKEMLLLTIPVFTEDAQEPRSILTTTMRTQYGLAIIANWKNDFSGKVGERLALTPVAREGGCAPFRILLVGLGSEDEVTVEKFRRAGGYAGQYAKENKISQVSCFLPPRRGLSSLYTSVDCTQAYIEGVALALYEYQHGKKEDAPASLIELFFPDTLFTEEVLTETVALISAKYLARDLGNTPANLLTPTVFAKKAEVLARYLGFTHRVFGLPGIKSRRMGLLLAVSRGSRETPVFFHAWYMPEREDGGIEPLPKVVLIGKGVTFDAGGTSLKPGLKMDEMKYDMCGGAAVIASMITVAEMKPNCEVHFVVPMTENLPDGNAVKPGDVVTAMDGQTVEVLNTDAEGRLILADAFCYVKEHIKPDGPDDIVLDFATLTGAVIIALGHYKTGFYSNNDELAEFIAGEADTGEALWRMPLVEEMEDELKSDFADMANIGNSQTGGSIMGALFLKKFIGEKWNWAHIDIAGTAWLKGKSAISYQPPGATGVMVGTIASILKTFK
jgi:leucyl aminopeptidase